MQTDQQTESAVKHSLEANRQRYEALVQSFRKDTVNAIREGRPLFLPMANANGDDMLIRAGYWEVLMQLCEEEQLDPHSVHVTAQPLDDLDNMHSRALGIFSHGVAFKVLDREKIERATLYQESLYEFSAALGVHLNPVVYEQSPKIWPTDKGPLKNVDGQKVAEYESAIREKLAGRPLIVIGQAGSAAEKRFTDEQLVQVAASARKRHPDAYILVVSDKEFLRKDIPKLLAMEKAPPFPVRSSKTKFSEAQIQRFEHELATALSPKQDNEIDEIVEITDINQLLAFFRMAIEADMTDGYWMHLAASQDVQKVVALFTLFQPEKWASPETITVKADALASEQRNAISSQWYHMNSAYEGQRDPSSYGIELKDIQKYLHALDQV